MEPNTPFDPEAILGALMLLIPVAWSLLRHSSQITKFKKQKATL